MVKFEESLSNPYAEISQHTDVKFATVGQGEDGLEQVHAWFKCKDFLNEVVVGMRTDTSHGIYGFKYDHTNPKHKSILDGTHLLMHSDKIDDIIWGIENVLNPVEETGDHQITTYEKLSDKVIYVQGDEAWWKETYLISAFSLILRAFWYRDKVEETTDFDTFLARVAALDTQNDAKLISEILTKTHSSYFKSLILKIKDLVTDDDTFATRFKDINTSFCHDMGGILNVTRQLVDPADEQRWSYKMYKELLPNQETLTDTLIRSAA